MMCPWASKCTGSTLRTLDDNQGLIVMPLRVKKRIGHPETYSTITYWALNISPLIGM